MGILTMTEIVDHTRRIVDSVTVPVIADGDTGHGGPLNVMRTVRGFEDAGAAAMHIEDQVHPKRCAYLPPSVPVVPREAAEKRLTAALEARHSDDFLIIARTDARQALGFEEVFKRCIAFAQLGADWVFCATLNSIEEARTIAAEVSVPLVVNLNITGALGKATVEELSTAGVSVALYASVVRTAVVKAAMEALVGLRRGGSQRAIEHLCASPRQYDELLDTDSWLDLDKRLG